MHRGRIAHAALLVTVTSGLLLAFACSRAVQHRVLTFLYDGVPPLHPELAGYEPQVSNTAQSTGQGESDGGLVAAETRSYSHPAYQRNLCGVCHDGEDGRVLMTVRQGLCQKCHPDKPPRKKFVHGPVAVNGCLACHHYHKAPYPKVLIADPQTLCFKCHVRRELTTGAYHAELDKKLCIDCHDAHGGDDRYFLLPGVAEQYAPEEAKKQEEEP